MISPFDSSCNQQFSNSSKSYSNTQLNHHNTLSPTTNRFSSSNSPKYDSHFSSNIVHTHLDYLRVSISNLNRKSLQQLEEYLFSGEITKTINKPWHPHPRMPKGKKYQSRIISQTGIILGYAKKGKYKGKNTRYVYDIMIDFTGGYFANLSLLEQIELIYYLNSNLNLKCHRIDVAIDDYSCQLFPVTQMVNAFSKGNNYGFQVIDDSYLNIIKNKLVGTLGLGSRTSSLFIRIYTMHEHFVRWEAELKKAKAQKLFDKLASLESVNKTKSTLQKTISYALAKAAINCIDFRDNSIYSNRKYASKSKTKRLPFWQDFIDKIGVSHHIKKSSQKK